MCFLLFFIWLWFTFIPMAGIKVACFFVTIVGDSAANECNRSLAAGASQCVLLVATQKPAPPPSRAAWTLAPTREQTDQIGSQRLSIVYLRHFFLLPNALIFLLYLP